MGATILLESKDCSLFVVVFIKAVINDEWKRR
jgi:hypothetical protein